MAYANGAVEPVCDKVNEPVRIACLDLQFRISLRQLRDDGREVRRSKG